MVKMVRHGLGGRKPIVEGAGNGEKWSVKDCGIHSEEAGLSNSVNKNINFQLNLNFRLMIYHIFI